jgi:hypothetical protein
VLSLGLILIVSGLLIRPPIPFTTSQEPSTWNNTPRQYVSYYHQLPGWAPSYPNQITHSGNLILNDGEEYVIENCTYILQGTFLASENSSLVVRNAELWVKNTEQWDPHGPFPLLADMIFTNSSRLQVVNSSIVSNYAADIVLLDESTADIRHSNLTLTILSGDDNSRIQADNSIFGFACVASNASCSLRSSQVDFLAPGFQIWHSYYTTASSYDIGPWVDSRAEVINSTINQLGLRTLDTTIRVRGSLAGEFPTWSPASICSGGRWFNVSVVDSNMGRIMLWADDSSLEITDNKDLNALVVTGGSVTLSGVSIPALIANNCTTSVNGSVLSSLQLLGDSDVSAKDSLTESIYLQDFNGNLACDQVRASRLWGSSVNGTVSGSLYIQYKESDLDVLQRSAKIRREYGVLAEAGGVAAEGVKLFLRNGKTTLWSGSTDASGRADFNATYYHLWWLGPGVYADENSTSMLTLIAMLGDEVKVSNVTIESNSPLVFSFEKQPTSPIWRNRYTLLIVGGLIITVTVAYVFSKSKRRVVSLQ